MKFPLSRRHLALLALVPALALTGCGGGDGDGDGGKAAPQPSTSAALSLVSPPPATTPSGGGAGAGTGAAAPPQPSASGDPRQAPAVQFNDCVRRQGAGLPTPGQTRRPTPEEIKKVQEALRTCVRTMSSPPSAPGN
ncbi:hypothetical protein [Actinomadura xylanilytica]|uniref:hypothetical protein n=1 Tax=Actinomadura xylanilytica TaxID=887459 RepID=UPI00255ABE62|nr:hypothetical protein [Actinomadura xylanilytica]MDL4775612.1 hypothetical protein [Actinomadura xylanilytica]